MVQPPHSQFDRTREAPVLCFRIWRVAEVDERVLADSQRFSPFALELDHGLKKTFRSALVELCD